MRFGNKNKKLRILFCTMLGFHYICDWYDTLSFLTQMKKEQIEIEYSLRSTSPNLIWRIISTEGGLQKWLADDVKAVEDKFFFTWGDEWRHHEKRCANKLECIRHSHIRLRWDDETDPDAYLELRMVHNEMTDGYSLHVTDFALPEDLDSLYDIWEQNFDQLRLATGL